MPFHWKIFPFKQSTKLSYSWFYNRIIAENFWEKQIIDQEIGIYSYEKYNTRKFKNQKLVIDENSISSDSFK